MAWAARVYCRWTAATGVLANIDHLHQISVENHCSLVSLRIMRVQRIEKQTHSAYCVSLQTVVLATHYKLEQVVMQKSIV